MSKSVDFWRRSRFPGAMFVVLLLAFGTISCDWLKEQEGECWPCKQATPTSPMTCAGTLECKLSTDGDYVCFERGAYRCNL